MVEYRLVDRSNNNPVECNTCYRKIKKLQIKYKNVGIETDVQVYYNS